MFSNYWNKRSEKELRIITVIIAVILSVIMVLGNVAVYHRYRENLIDNEQGQLLTIARTIGTSLEQYIEQEIGKTDLCFDSLTVVEDEETGQIGESAEAGNGNKTVSGNTDAENSSKTSSGDTDAENSSKTSSEDTEAIGSTIDRMRDVAEMMINGSDGLYRKCSCIRDGEVIFHLGEGTISMQDVTVPPVGKACILGKYQAETGWYEMLIGKSVRLQDGTYTVVFAMDLSKVHKKIVLPVKIGSGGYSVVKDSSLAIIMHHARNQIGMDALYDRKEMYPDLNLTSLGEWLEMQRVQEEGTGILDSYVWDDPELHAVQRIVAYTTIDIEGERWIVNSTLPISELAEPLRRMFLIMAAVSILYLIAIVIILVGITASLSRAEAQKKEIHYLKEINRGMEAAARKNDEIRHYQRVQSMGMMSSHIAHEFNNYLTPVMVYGELLESDESMSDENKAMVGEMLKSVGQAAKLSRELLDFSRMDAGSRMTALNLTQQAQEAVSVIRQLVPARISFSAEISEKSAWVKGREGMMQHILMNLCKNAFHAMEDSPEKKLRIIYQVSVSGDYPAVLTVSDTGCGIKEENLRNIFEPFYTTRGSSQGTGLGLSVVRTMVENVGGTIKVESEEGKGTTFTMCFPAVPSKEQLDGESAGKADHSNERIICVCRDKKTLEPWKEWLDSLGSGIKYTFHEAAVVARMQEDKDYCDRLIIENELEIMSGIDLAQIVKRANAEIRVTLLTREISAQQQWYLDNGFLDEIRLP